VAETVTRIHEHQMSKHGTLYPTKASPGEELADEFSRISYVDFLLRDQQIEIAVDQATVKQEMDYLSAHVVIAYFLGGKPAETQLGNGTPK